MYLTPQRYPTIVAPATWSIVDDYETTSAQGSWGVDDVRLNRTYTVRLFMLCSSKYAGMAQAIGAVQAQGPLIGDSYQFPMFSQGQSPTENDTGSFLQRIDVERASEQAQAGMYWYATLYYEPFDVVHQLGNSELDQGLINPLDRYPEAYWSSAKYNIHKVEDEADPPNVYLNTVGDPLLDTPQVEETRPTLKFIRNESTYDDDYASQFKDSTNSDVFLGYPPNTVKCSDITGERIYDSDWGNYYKVTYMFEFRDDDDGNGYTLLLQNIGFNQLAGGTGNPVPVLINGQVPTDAVPLQQDGSYQPKMGPYQIPFTQFPSIEFAGLNIPTDVLTADS